MDMKGWVLGIVGVFCLQLGFIAFTAIDRPFGTLIAVNEITVGTNPVASTLDIPNDAEFLDSQTDQGISEVLGDVLTVSSSPRRNRRTAGIPGRSSKKFVKTPISRPVNFDSVIIAVRKHPEIKFKTEYPRAAAIERALRNNQPSAQTIPPPYPQPEKKSFASKSLSVLKKPYDWLKALGAKLK